MSGEVQPVLTGVVGGAGGTRVVVDDVEQLAAVCLRVEQEVREGAATLALARAGAVVESTAVLSPVTAARAADALGAAALGPGAPLTVTAGSSLLGAGLQTAARAYDATEVATTALWDLHDGAALVSDAVELARAPQAGAGRLLGAWEEQSAEAGRPLTPQEAAERWLVEHPDEVEHRVNGMGVLAAPVAALSRLGRGEAVLGRQAVLAPVAVTARGLAPMWDQGEPAVSLVDGPRPASAPRTTEDLVRGLEETNGADDGTIALRTVTHGDGRAAMVVDLPGTDSWALPGQETDQVRDLGADVQLLGGDDVAYTRGVEAAVVASGVSRQTPIALVGHSQGGMSAVVVADRLRRQGYAVTHVVAVGSPLATLRDAEGVRTLALENSRDLVPRADGRANRDEASRTTVTFDRGGDALEGQHDLSTYAEGARLVDRSVAADRSIGAVVDSMHQAGVLVGDDPQAVASVQRVRVTAVRGRLP